MKKMNEKQIYECLKILQNSINMDVRARILEELINVDEQTLVDFIKKVRYAEKDTEILAYISEIVVKKNIKERAQLILPFILSSDPSLRTHICGLLGNCEDRIALDALISRLTTDPSVDVRVAAAYALGRIGDPDALKDLTWAKGNDFAVDSQGWSVSQQASRAIKEIHNKHSSSINDD